MLVRIPQRDSPHHYEGEIACQCPSGDEESSDGR